MIRAHLEVVSIRTLSGLPHVVISAVYIVCFCEGEKGKFSMCPTSGGTAERAGVRKGDRLIWLDGATVSELSHSAISKMVRLQKMYVSVHCKCVFSI